MRAFLTFGMACVLAALPVYLVNAQMGSPQEQGGGFTTPATVDLDMDSNNLLNVGYLESDVADPADSGLIRGGNGVALVCSEANPTGVDRCLSVLTSNSLYYNGQIYSGSTGFGTSSTGALDIASRAALSAPAAGQFRMGVGGAGVVLDFNDAVDVLSVKDFAGTGVGSIAVDVGGRLHVEGATGNSYWTRSGSTMLGHVDGTNVLTLAAGVTDNTWVALNKVSQAGSATAVSHYYRRPDATPTAADVIANDIYQAYDDTPTPNITHVQVIYTQQDPADSDHDGGWELQVANDGSMTPAITVDMSDGVETVELGVPLVVPTYVLHIDVAAGGALSGPTAPSPVVQDTFILLEFDADAEQVHASQEIPDCWDGVSDITLKIYWASEAGDPIADGETVKWDCGYRSIAWGSETTDNGTMVSVTTTYTQSGAGTDSETFEHELTFDYDSANQPLTAGDTLGFLCDRDVSGDTYSGGALFDRFEIALNCTGIPNH